jgi:hypothetical protein
MTLLTFYYRSHIARGEAMDDQTEILKEMRDLLRIMAEPAIAERDKRLRLALREVVGKSKTRAKATIEMDGTKSQSVIAKASGLDAGALSRLVKALRSASLLAPGDKVPKLNLTLPSNFFDDLEA